MTVSSHGWDMNFYIFFSNIVFAVRWVVYPTKSLLFFLSTRCWRDADALSNHLSLPEGLPYQKLKTNLMNYCNVDSCGWESKEILETSYAFEFYGSESEGYLGRLLVENLMDHKSWENLEIYFVQFRFLWINIPRNASIFCAVSNHIVVIIIVVIIRVNGKICPRNNTCNVSQSSSAHIWWSTLLR